jgi:hypothetical protein
MILQFQKSLSNSSYFYLFIFPKSSKEFGSAYELSKENNKNKNQFVPKKDRQQQKQKLICTEKQRDRQQQKQTVNPKRNTKRQQQTS